MMESPAGAVRPLPPNPPPGGDQYRSFEDAGQLDGPPMLPPISAFNDDSGLPANLQRGTPPPGPSSFAAATPPQSPGLNPASGQGKNRNPLTDLIDSEEQFVALMSAIIRVSNKGVTHVALQSLTFSSESSIGMVKIKLPAARTRSNVQRYRRCLQGQPCLSWRQYLSYIIHNLGVLTTCLATKRNWTKPVLAQGSGRSSHALGEFSL